jgi:hypothetical protein
LETMAKANEDMVHSALKEKNDDGRATAWAEDAWVK